MFALTVSRWQKDLEIYERKGRLPSKLVSLLRELVSATMHSYIAPAATSRLISLSKKHLIGGISLNEKCFDVMVHVPDDTKHWRPFFVLVPKWPGGELKRLNEL